MSRGGSVTRYFRKWCPKKWITPVITLVLPVLVNLVFHDYYNYLNLKRY